MLGVVPCAGSSSRMGRSKALLDARGRTFLARVVDALRGGGCDSVTVVVGEPWGPEAEQARALGCHVVHNPAPGDGPITSVRAALDAHGAGLEGIVVLPVDHPTVAASTVRILIDAAEAADAPIVVPRCGHRRGHPVVFRAGVFEELMDPELPEGARTVVRRHPERVLEVEVDDEGVLRDIDDPDTYRALFRSEPREPGSGPGAGQIAGFVVDQVEAGRSVVVATRLDGSGLRRAIVFGSFDPLDSVGSLGSGDLDSAIDELALAVLRGERPTGRTELGEVPLYVEAHSPRPDMVVMGAGHIAQPLCTFGARLGFRVIVADDRAEFVTAERFPDADATTVVDFADPFAEIPLTHLTHLVLVTRGHKYDFECLRAALSAEVTPRYVGMIGSRRRVRATFQQLLSEGVAPDALARVRAPVGLDLGSETPAEIAVAVAAEMIMEWRGGSGAPLHRTERVLERFFTEGEG